jgi:hypothetical protein
MPDPSRPAIAILAGASNLVPRGALRSPGGGQCGFRRARGAASYLTLCHFRLKLR